MFCNETSHREIVKKENNGTRSVRNGVCSEKPTGTTHIYQDIIDHDDDDDDVLKNDTRTHTTHLPTHNPCIFNCGIHNAASFICTLYCSSNIVSPSLCACIISSLDMQYMNSASRSLI